MVRLARSRRSLRSVAKEFGVSVSTVSLWVARCAGQRLDRCSFADGKPGRAWNRTNTRVERRIVRLRQSLREDSVLGEYGAKAIGNALCAEPRSEGPPPARATIHRILGRYGMLDGARRIRRPAPPKGWYLPDVAAQRAEIDCFDFIEDLKIADGPLVSVLTAKSLHGALTDAWALERPTAKRTLYWLLARWQREGLPAYAQFDNDTLFQGAHQFAHAVGRVSRLCLALGVVPVFVPPLEHGMQNTIESFNALWQAKLWQRYRVVSLRELQRRSDRYIAAHHARMADTIERAPRRRRIPAGFTLDLHAPLAGHMIFIRRTDEHGRVHLLGQRLTASNIWAHRLVRCEVDFDHHVIRCFALRRRNPSDQPLLATIPYHRPNKPFQGQS